MHTEATNNTFPQRASRITTGLRFPQHNNVRGSFHIRGMHALWILLSK